MATKKITLNELRTLVKQIIKEETFSFNYTGEDSLQQEIGRIKNMSQDEFEDAILSLQNKSKGNDGWRDNQYLEPKDDFDRGDYVFEDGRYIYLKCLKDTDIQKRLSNKFITNLVTPWDLNPIEVLEALGVRGEIFWKKMTDSSNYLYTDIQEYLKRLFKKQNNEFKNYNKKVVEKYNL
jgi:hypothetical protein